MPKEVSQTVVNALRLLECFAEEEELGITELAADINVGESGGSQAGGQPGGVWLSAAKPSDQEIPVWVSDWPFSGIWSVSAARSFSWWSPGCGN